MEDKKKADGSNIIKPSYFQAKKILDKLEELNEKNEFSGFVNYEPMLAGILFANSERYKKENRKSLKSDYSLLPYYFDKEKNKKALEKYSLYISDLPSSKENKEKFLSESENLKSSTEFIDRLTRERIKILSPELYDKNETTEILILRQFIKVFGTFKDVTTHTLSVLSSYLNYYYRGTNDKKTKSFSKKINSEFVNSHNGEIEPDVIKFIYIVSNFGDKIVLGKKEKTAVLKVLSPSAAKEEKNDSFDDGYFSVSSFADTEKISDCLKTNSIYPCDIITGYGFDVSKAVKILYSKLSVEDKKNTDLQANLSILPTKLKRGLWSNSSFSVMHAAESLAQNYITESTREYVYLYALAFGLDAEKLRALTDFCGLPPFSLTRADDLTFLYAANNSENAAEAADKTFRILREYRRLKKISEKKKNPVSDSEESGAGETSELTKDEENDGTEEYFIKNFENIMSLSGSDFALYASLNVELPAQENTKESVFGEKLESKLWELIKKDNSGKAVSKITSSAVNPDLYPNSAAAERKIDFLPFMAEKNQSLYSRQCVLVLYYCCFSLFVYENKKTVDSVFSSYESFENAFLNIYPNSFFGAEGGLDGILKKEGFKPFDKNDIFDSIILAKAYFSYFDAEEKAEKPETKEKSDNDNLKQPTEIREEKESSETDNHITEDGKKPKTGKSKAENENKPEKKTSLKKSASQAKKQAPARKKTKQDKSDKNNLSDENTAMSEKISYEKDEKESPPDKKPAKKAASKKPSGQAKKQRPSRKKTKSENEKSDMNKEKKLKGQNSNG